MEISNIELIRNFVGKLHFVGIGGIGMSGMAEVLCDMGFDIQGSDINESDNVKRLRNRNIKVFIGHQPSNIDGVAYLVISSDIKQNNIEVVTAKERGIPVVSRAEMLAEITKFKHTIAISGSHGKTTTTTLMATMFENAKMDPTVITGGIINSKKTNAYLGSGHYLIVEADESDGTFIKIPSFVAVITNIDPEHLNYYGTFDNLKQAFVTFILNLPFYGFAVVCDDHEVVREITQDIHSRNILYYSCKNPEADVFADNLRYTKQGVYFDVFIGQKFGYKLNKIENILLPMFGDHNVLNSLSTIAVGLKLGFKEDKIINGFKGFEGVKRRFTKVGEFNGAVIIDDYAHHPVEIEATIKTAIKILEGTEGKLIAIVQPHRYSRLADLMEEFSTCFKGADLVYVSDVYAAGEDPIDGVNSEVLINKIRINYPDMNVKHIDSYEAMVNKISEDVSSGDLILMMGAGSITKWANDMQKSLETIGSK